MRDYDDILRALKRIRCDNNRCFGCGWEHDCSVKGCAIERAAYDAIEQLRSDLSASEVARADLGKRLAAAQQQAAAQNEVPYAERLLVYQAAIQKWGIALQIIVAIEEMSELTKELCKDRRSKLVRESLIDEIADVTIMMEQLRVIFGINEEVCRRMDAKVRRLKDRVEGTGT